MATKKAKNNEPIRLTPTQLRAKVEDLEQEKENLRLTNEKLENGAFCYMCDRHKTKDQFYKSSDTQIKSGVTRICKRCAFLIANPPDETGKPTEPTKATVMAALEYLDKPFLNKLWDSSYFECHNGQKHAKVNIWTAYIKNVAMDQYRGLRWKDSDIFKTNVSIGHMDKALPSIEEEKLDEEKQSIIDSIQLEYEKNKRDVIKQVGYDPFANYPSESDKPFLYGSLNSFIDEESKNDGMKLKAVIQIVKTYNQIEKLNDQIDMLLSDPTTTAMNSAEIDKKASTVDKMIRSSATLAKDNGIAVNFNNNKSKGANTLSGKIKYLTEIGFENVKINAFDYETCEGMRQVAELSEMARHKQIGYDENIAQEIKDIKVELVEKSIKERDSALETSRILLQENLRLKNFLKSKGLVDDNFQAILS